jgi:hypothetical protein
MGLLRGDPQGDASAVSFLAVAAAPRISGLDIRAGGFMPMRPGECFGAEKNLESKLEKDFLSAVAPGDQDLAADHDPWPGRCCSPRALAV